MLSRPYPHWDDIKRTYPHAMHHRGRKDEFVSIEMPGTFWWGLGVCVCAGRPRRQAKAHAPHPLIRFPPLV